MSDAVLMEIREKLGRHEALLEGQGKLLERIDAKMDKVDNRLRDVEAKSAVTGSIAGGVVGLAVTYIAAQFKNMT